MRRPPVDPRWIVVLLLAGLFYLRFTQDAPYHVDTARYVRTAKAALATHSLPAVLEYRFLNAYWYIPFLWLFHDAGIKIASVVLVLAFAFTYYPVIRREFGARVALASSLVMLALPATVMTVTHLKEDFLGLTMITASLWLLRPGASIPRVAFAGAFFGLACLSKEFPFILLPFMLLHVALGRSPAQRFRDLWSPVRLRRAAGAALAFVGAAAATMLVISPHHFQYVSAMAAAPHEGRFLGIASPVQAAGIRSWQHGMLHLAPWHLLLVPLAIWAVIRRAFVVLVWLAAASWTFVVLTNMTVVRDRLFTVTGYFTVPLIIVTVFGGLDLASARARDGRKARARDSRARRQAQPSRTGSPSRRWLPASILYALTAVMVFAQLSELVPTLEYRHRYPPQARFYGGLDRVLPANAIVIGADNCLLAPYYVDRPCLRAPVDADASGADAFARTLADSLANHALYVLPDLLAYDRGGELRRALQARFTAEPAYTALGEDYHALTYGPRLDGFLKEIESRTGCAATVTGSEPFPVDTSIVLSRERLLLRCPGGQEKMDLLTYRGFQTFLTPLTVERLVPREPHTP